MKGIGIAFSVLMLSWGGLFESASAFAGPVLTVEPLMVVTNDALSGGPATFRVLADPATGDIASLRYDTVPDFTLAQLRQGITLMSKNEGFVGNVMVARISGSIDARAGGNATIGLLREGGLMGFDYRQFHISLVRQGQTWQVYSNEQGRALFDAIDLHAMRDDNGDADGIEVVTLSLHGKAVRVIDTGSLSEGR